ncbi:hypothetical protein Nmel_005162 [Mimus melanotis]
MNRVYIGCDLPAELECLQKSEKVEINKWPWNKGEWQGLQLDLAEQSSQSKIIQVLLCKRTVPVVVQMCISIIEIACWCSQAPSLCQSSSLCRKGRCWRGESQSNSACAVLLFCWQFLHCVWLETHSASDVAIYKPEVAEICIETKLQIKVVSTSLLLKDKTTVEELTSCHLKIGPRY